MSYNETTTNLFYQNFKETGLSAPFVAMIAARWAISMLGSVLNFSLVYVTIRSRTLHGTCSFLIALNALCTALFEPCLGIGLYIALSRIYFIPLRTCFALQAVPAFFGYMTLATLLAIGFDRLVSVLATPFWNLQEWPIPYVCGIISLCLGYSMFSVWQLFQVSLELPLLPVICSSPGELQQGEIGKLMYRLNVCVNLALLVEYCLLWVAFRMRQHKLASAEFTRRIIRSLSVITLLITGGWVTNSVARLLLPTMELSAPTLAYTAFSFSFLPILVMTANAPVLFLFSHEYRRAYAKQFPRLLNAYVMNVSTLTVAHPQAPKATLATVKHPF